MFPGKSTPKRAIRPHIQTVAEQQEELYQEALVQIEVKDKEIEAKDEEIKTKDEEIKAKDEEIKAMACKIEQICRAIVADGTRFAVINAINEIRLGGGT